MSLILFFFFFKQKTAYEIVMRLEFRRVLFRSGRTARDCSRIRRADPLGEELLETVDRRPEREPSRPQHVEDELLLALVQVRTGERNLRDGCTRVSQARRRRASASPERSDGTTQSPGKCASIFRG